VDTRGGEGCLFLLGSLMVVAWGSFMQPVAFDASNEVLTAAAKQVFEFVKSAWLVDSQKAPCGSRVCVLHLSCGLVSTTHPHNDSQLLGEAARGVMWPLTCWVLLWCAVVCLLLRPAPAGA